MGNPMPTVGLYVRSKNNAPGAMRCSNETLTAITNKASEKFKCVDCRSWENFHPQQLQTRLFLFEIYPRKIVSLFWSENHEHTIAIIEANLSYKANWSHCSWTKQQDKTHWYSKTISSILAAIIIGEVQLHGHVDDNVWRWKIDAPFVDRNECKIHTQRSANT